MQSETTYAGTELAFGKEENAKGDAKLILQMQGNILFSDEVLVCTHLSVPIQDKGNCILRGARFAQQLHHLNYGGKAFGSTARKLLEREREKRG